MASDIGGKFIERLSWAEVGRRIDRGAAAVLRIGGGAKQDGSHLPLNADRIEGVWLSARLAERIDVLIWPTVTYGYYPGFVEYAGSSGLSAPVFESIIAEIASDILGFGCRALFVLDTGISTIAPIDRALARLKRRNILHLRVYEGPRYRRAAENLAEQSHGSHADELETSVRLALAPDPVDRPAPE